MIEFFLGHTFPAHYGLDPNSISVPMYRTDKSFTETDKVSCTRCHQLPERAYRAGCNEEILKVNNNGKNLCVIRLEAYFHQFERGIPDLRDRCDLMITTSGVEHEKIVFCDLCCYAEKFVEPNHGRMYPEGKRAKARQQMMRSIELLMQNSMTAVNILTYPQKVCLFAWRDYDVPDAPVHASRGNARANMQVFGSVASNMVGQTTSHQTLMDHGFTFVQVKYPSVYEWQC